ncbi:MAG: branched chain amino acid ABC transporter substrate-binding protein [Rhodospirillaceae bacterium]|jgi:branched-chain amino acid transport system substrate-binding protein|nr:branched chain amino acid ABC transporter substrate-binding protein [Rhodospirillaceae bacterium]
MKTAFSVAATFLTLLTSMIARSPAIADDIVIAVAGPITGQYAIFGQQMLRGAEMAVSDINRAGGVLGKQLVLEVGDDACEAKQAVAVANQMANKGVVFMAGHFCSSTSIPASEVYFEEGILQISPASTNPTLTERGFDNVFRTCGRDDQQGQVAGSFLAEKFPGSRIAILHDKTAYGKGLADETRKELRSRGIEAVLYEAYTAGEKDYSALVSKLKVASIEIIYLGGYHTEAGLIVRQARAQGLSARLVSGDALVTEEFWSITGDAGEGTMFSFSPDPSKNAEAADVVERFEAQGFRPEGYTLYTYAAIQVFAQAVEMVGTTDVDALISKLRTETFDTVFGGIGFDIRGDVNAPGYVFYEWSNGEYSYTDM